MARLSFLPLVLFAAIGAAAVAAAPDAPKQADAEVLPAPPKAAVLLTAALGRHAAAADVAWLRTVQFIGAPQSERLHYDGLAPWIELTNDLDPKFELPYYHGSILLSTEPQQNIHAEDILVRAEHNLVPESCRDESACPAIDRTDYDSMFATCAPCPALVEQECNWAVPMARAFVHFFGFLDPQAASEHFCQASRRGGPYVTRHRAATLQNQASTCAEVRTELFRMMQSGEKGGGAEMLSQNRLRIAIHCEEETIAQAASSYRVRFRRNPQQLSELLDTGVLKEPPWTPHPRQCWVLRAAKPELEVCSP